MEPVDLLLITWNRRDYVEKTLANLLSDNADFRLYCWDNDSQDGTADLIASLNDPRIVRREFSKTNVKQRTPTLWFFDQAIGDVVGKIDDDILLPHGWTQRIAPLVRNEPTFGMLGCWIFMEEDWDINLAKHKIIEKNGEQVFRTMSIAGQSFLARLETLKNHILPEGEGYGFPIDQYKMAEHGLINGYPLPILFAHNMDDPRSSHCMNYSNNKIGSFGALTARTFGFETAADYANWIRDDAKRMLLEPLEKQMRRVRLSRDRSLLGRIKRKFYKLIDKHQY